MRWFTTLVLFGALAACRNAAKTPPAPLAAAPIARAPQTAARTPADSEAPRRRTPPGAVDPPKLPEDPVAAKRAEAQWREHLDREEEERQMAFDQPRLKQHRSLVRTLKSIRASYDRAKNEAALEKARTAARPQLEAFETRVHELDPWGVNSHVLPDYTALRETFASAYPDAKLKQFSGDAAAFEAARDGVDAHLHTIAEWLEEAADEKDEK